MIVYGIKNCDTVKKATNWLKSKEFNFTFHDYKTQSISEEKLKQWVEQVSWEILINRKGTTWKQLNESVKEKIINKSEAIELMKSKTSIIKRPIIEINGKIMVVGYNEEEYANKLK
jgi:arsenate reductase